MLYREVDFCYEKLGMPYCKFVKLPAWERTMISIYLDIKEEKFLKWKDEQGSNVSEEKGE